MLPMWQMLSVTNDGLVGYRRTGGPAGDTLVPDLATALPAPANGGRTYTFHLRPGIRYSNGTPVRPEDFRRAIERVFAINAGPAAYYTGIIGAGQCERTPGAAISRAASSPTTRPTRSPSTSPRRTRSSSYKLAFPFADAVPAGTPDHQIGPAQLPATGPYMTQSFVPRHRWVLVRNPQFHPWSSQAQPERLPQPDHPAARHPPGAGGQRGRAEPRRRAPVASPGQDLPAGDALSRASCTAARWAPPSASCLNTRVWPFNVLAARQALNYAIDRATLIRLIGGPLMAQPTCQILPPATARLPAVLPVHDQPQPRRRLDGARPRQGGAACPRLRHPRRQGDRGHRCLRHADPGPGDRPLPGVGPRRARIPGIAASDHRPGRIQPGGSTTPASACRSAGSPGTRTTRHRQTSSARSSHATPSSRTTRTT